MQSRRFSLLLALALFAAAPGARAGIFDDDEARARIEQLRKQYEANRTAVEERLGRIETEVRDRRALVDLANQIEALKTDIARMRGQIEVLLNQAETADKRQKDLYVDVDSRLRKLEQAREQAAASTEKPAAPPAEAAAAETRAYEAALNQFKLGNYPLAISAFQGFMVTYPSSPLAPSAQYWIGNAYYAQRDYKNAITAQQKVLTAWPDNSKAPDAMLNIATSQEAAGDRRGALKTLEGLVARFPASPAAATAKQRLQKK
jgi:tol-pal system protein YbgF